MKELLKHYNLYVFARILVDLIKSYNITKMITKGLFCKNPDRSNDLCNDKTFYQRDLNSPKHT